MGSRPPAATTPAAAAGVAESLLQRALQPAHSVARQPAVCAESPNCLAIERQHSRQPVCESPDVAAIAQSCPLEQSDADEFPHDPALDVAANAGPDACESRSEVGNES